MIYVLEGTAILESGEEKQKLKKGECAYLAQGSVYRIVNDGDLDVAYTIIIGKDIRERFEKSAA